MLSFPINIRVPGEKLGNTLDAICQRDELLICPTFPIIHSAADRDFIAN